MTLVSVRVKRVYDPPAPDDGLRVLVDRLWPRGLAKADAPFDRWLKEVAPSDELRRWYGHDPEKFAEFAERYRAELKDGRAGVALAELREAAAAGPVTLLTATRDVARSQAAVLAEVLGGGR